MLSYMKPIPAKDAVLRGEELNILSGVSGSDEDMSFKVTVWGRIGAGWKPLSEKEIDLDGGEHKHLYFTLQPEVFSASFWGEETDEIELLVSDKKPEDDERGVVVFID